MIVGTLVHRGATLQKAEAVPSRTRWRVALDPRAIRRCQTRAPALGLVAVVQIDSNPMETLGWKADNRPGRMSALTDTGRSATLKRPDFNDSYRPGAVAGTLLSLGQ